MKYLILLLVAVLCFNTACQKADSRIDAVVIDVKIPGNDTLRADGLSLTRVKVVLPANITEEFRTVTFSGTSLGTYQNLANSKLRIDSTGAANALLLMGMVSGTNYVTVSITKGTQTFTQTEPFIIKPSNPDNIVIESAASTIDVTTPNVFNIYLLKKRGYVSKGVTAKVELYQLDISGKSTSVGRVSDLIGKGVVDTTGKISFNVNADTGDIDKTLPLYVKVSALNDANEPVTSIYAIRIKK
ncbi:hypothetical protein [Mucilaginibacter sp. HD30]